ncbi:hypothetical protein J4E91_007588 [Alternaria rosae]|nr:hypothetical protein J4E91_007588 [Alternaria rosae]
MKAPSNDKDCIQDSSQQLDYIHGSSHKVLNFQNANSRRYAVNDENGHVSGTEWEWWSRENRKAWWDVSWWVGVVFTVGSICSITSGVFQWLPVAYPERQFAADPTTVSGAISFFRGMLFLLGGMLLVVEAVNANQSDCFGWALKESLKPDNENIEFASPDEEKATENASGFQPDRRNCTHIHNPDRMKHRIMHTKTFKVEARPQSGPEQAWNWWPTWQDIRAHYRREIGFNANFMLFVGTVIYWVTNLLTLPGVYENLPQGVLYGLYYPSFLLGAVCFLVASILYLFEVQYQWWKPAPRMIGCLLKLYEAVEKWPIHIER